MSHFIHRFHKAIVIMAYIPLLLTEENMKNLSENLSSENIEQKIRENRQFLMTPLGQAGKRLRILEPVESGRSVFFNDSNSFSTERRVQ